MKPIFKTKFLHEVSIPESAAKRLEGLYRASNEIQMQIQTYKQVLLDTNPSATRLDPNGYYDLPVITNPQNGQRMISAYNKLIFYPNQGIPQPEPVPEPTDEEKKETEMKDKSLKLIKDRPQPEPIPPNDAPGKDVNLVKPTQNEPVS